MRVLFVNDSCNTGGVTSQTKTLAAKMASLGHDITFFYYWKSGINTKNEFRQFYNPYQSLGQLLCKECFDIIICDLAVMRHGFERTLRLTRCKTPVIAICHGFSTIPFAKGIKHHIVAVSEYIRNLLLETTSADVTTIINGVDTDIFKPDGPFKTTTGPIALWVGRSDDPCKDFPGLMLLLPGLSDHGYKIWIIDGAVDKRWVSAQDWLGRNINVLRDINLNNLADIYRTTAKSGGFLISTSKEESLGIALLEAMACGCTVIAPKVGGTPEIIKDGVDGYLYDRNNARDAIEHIITNGHKKPNITGNAAKKVKSEINADIMTDEYIRLCIQLTAGKKTSTLISILYKRLLGYLLDIRKLLQPRH